MKNLIIIGNGKLSNGIIDNFYRYSDVPVKRYSENIETSRQTVFVHIGSGRQYHEALDIALINNSTFIQAATEKEISMEIPEKGDFKFITAPNLDLNIVRLFYLLSFAGDLFSEEKVSITESHQKDKTSKAGTAIKIANYLKSSEESIISIRDQKLQRKLNISNMNQHAYHEIKIGDNDSSVTLTTKIEGFIGYVKGLAQICASTESLDDGIYEIEDLIKLNLL